MTVHEEFLDFEARKMGERGPSGLQEMVRRQVLGLRTVIDTNILFYHPFDSRKSQAGYPDCTIVIPNQGRLIYAELKTYQARPTVAQAEWLDRLSCLHAKHASRTENVVVDAIECYRCECYLWRPQHYYHDVIRLVLMGNPEAATYPTGRWMPFGGVPGDPYSEPKG
jgi:hypothetical protein